MKDITKAFKQGFLDGFKGYFSPIIGLIRYAKKIVSCSSKDSQNSQPK